VTSTPDILAQAGKHVFHGVGDWLAASPADVNASDVRGWTVLHHCAAAEAEGKDVEDTVSMLLQAGADPHQPDAKGDTPFNIAAPASPVSGRLMTNHWLAEALEGRGPKKLNDRSGSHGSTLAQYMAKWSTDEEIEQQLRDAVLKGLKVDVLNASGWTPLSAAAAMGRAAAVRAFIWHYTHDTVYARTTEPYTASYGGHKVTYGTGLSAPEIAYARLEQDKGASPALQSGLSACIAIILMRT
jgi:ankyrin repeat protein